MTDFTIGPTIFVTALLTILAATNPARGEDIPIVQPNASGVLFTIGDEDGVRYPYKKSGWSGIDQFACTIGKDCDVSTFPSHLRTTSSEADWADTAVERVRVKFATSAPFDDVVLRLVRAGAETIVVRLDDREDMMVTKSMMTPKTYEHSGFGAVNLQLGRVNAGTHVLQLSVAEDGEGNARFGWDSILLRALAP